MGENSRSSNSGRQNSSGTALIRSYSFIRQLPLSRTNRSEVSRAAAASCPGAKGM